MRPVGDGRGLGSLSYMVVAELCRSRVALAGPDVSTFRLLSDARVNLVKLVSCEGRRAARSG